MNSQLFVMFTLSLYCIFQERKITSTGVQDNAKTQSKPEIAKGKAKKKV